MWEKILFPALLILLFLGIGIVAIYYEIFVPRWLLVLGNYDEWWIPVRVLLPEGTMYLLAKGTPSGPFAGLIESIVTHTYDEDEDKFISVKERAKEKPKDRTEVFLAKHGIAWVGFNRFIIVRDVRYDKWEKLPNSSKWGLVSKDRGGPSIYFQYNMGTSVEKVDTVGNFPVSAVVTFTIQILEPRKAFFFAGGWEVQANAGVQGVLRQYIGTKDIEELRAEKAEKKTGQLVELLTDPKGQLNRDLLENFGVLIIAATFIDYDLEAGDAETNKAVKALESARLLGEAKILDATNDATAMKNRSEGIRAEYSARAEAGKEHAGTFAMAEAIKIAMPKAIGGNFLPTIETK